MVSNSSIKDRDALIQSSSNEESFDNREPKKYREYSAGKSRS
jgi:hypothetical protein